MRLVDRYLLRSFLASLLYCLFIFISLYIIMDLFGHLDEIVKRHVAMRLLLIYYMAYVPSIIIQTTPIAILIATMYTLGNMARHNEITALRASGISFWAILKPFLITGLLVSSLVLIINDRIAPRSMQLLLKIREEKFEKKKTGLYTKIIKDVALYGQGNKIIYARSYNPKIKVLKDILIHEHDRRQVIISKTTAKEARWTQNGWAAFSIATYKVDKDGQIREEPKFQHRGTLNISEGPQDFQNQKYKVEVLTLWELRHYIKRLSGVSGLVLQNLLVEAYNRISYPFANLVAVIIGAAFCLRIKKGGRLLGIGLGFLIGLLFYGVFAVSISLGKGMLLTPFISAWLSNILFSFWGIWLINKY